MENFFEGLERIKEENSKKRLNIMTSVMDVSGDGCEGHKQVNVVKYYSVRPKEYFSDRRYEEHKGMTFVKDVIDIRPRSFKNETQLKYFIERLNKLAGRTIEDDELNLLFRAITKGRHYKLVCLKDVTREFERETMWNDFK